MRRSPHDTVLQEIKVAEPAQLLEFLIAKNVRKSRNAIKSLLAHKQIKVNGKMVTQFDHDLNKGDFVEVMKFNQARKSKKLKGMTIVFEDQYLIVVEKDAGILSISTEKEKSGTAYGILNEYVKRENRNARALVLHRLDREMSGLMVFAKDQDVQTLFQTSWNKIVPVYTYVGVIYGSLKPEKGTIVSWLTENKNFVVFSSPTDNGGQKAITHYNVLKSDNRYSVITFDLETRRKNQLRAQLKMLNHPIVGDKKYGADSNPIKRMALHAQDMVIIHPITKERLEFKSPIPKKMSDLLAEKKIEITEK